MSITIASCREAQVPSCDTYKKAKQAIIQRIIGMTQNLSNSGLMIRFEERKNGSLSEANIKKLGGHFSKRGYIMEVVTQTNTITERVYTAEGEQTQTEDEKIHKLILNIENPLSPEELEKHTISENWQKKCDAHDFQKFLQDDKYRYDRALASIIVALKENYRPYFTFETGRYFIPPELAFQIIKDPKISELKYEGQITNVNIQFCYVGDSNN